MGFRITTNMLMNSYRYNLQGSTKKLADARDMVLTGRYFNSYAEDPAAATLAFRLRRSWYQTSNYIANTQDVYSKFNTAWNDLTGIVHDLSDANARVASIRGNNGTAGEARSSLAITLREMSEAVVQAMNQKLGDHFLFAGNDALNPPFSWENGKLLYRGVDVMGGWVDFSTEYPVPDWVNMDPKTGKITVSNNVPASSTDPWEQAWIDYYNDQYYREMDAVSSPASRPEWVDKASFFDGNGNLKETELRSWLQDYSINGVTSADEAWIEYYNKRRELASEPEWVDNAAFFDVDGSLKEADLRAWLQDNRDNNEATEVDEAWIEYLKNPNSTPPGQEWIDQEYQNLIHEPDWFAAGDPTLADENDPYDAAWLEYFKYCEEKEDWLAAHENPAPDPSSYKPEWTKNKVFFDEDGKLDEDAVTKWLETEPNEGVTNLDKVWMEYYGKLYDAQGDLRTLKKMSGEKMYIDLGMGAAENSPNDPVTGTYFNSALCGIDFLGFGVDEDGDPKNLALIMRELADVFEKWGENGQMYLPDDYRNKSYEEIQAILDSKEPKVMAHAAELRAYHAQQEERAFRLMDKLKAAQEHLTERWVDLDAQSVYLTTAESRLTTQATDLNIQFLNVEQVDLAEAITNFSWQQYCYNAALRVGNQLLSQTLIDYMG